MSEEGYEEIVVDLSTIPLTPVGKKDIQRLEMALIIATLYSPEVLELIRDPVERATWVDSLAVAAAALARSKAGYPISRIADEIGRSETMVRAHLSGKTKAGKLVLKTYEKLLRGQLKIRIPFVGKPLLPEDVEKELERLRSENEELKKRVKELEEKLGSIESEKKGLEEELERVKKELEEKTRVIEEVKRILSSI